MAGRVREAERKTYGFFQRLGCIAGTVIFGLVFLGPLLQAFLPQIIAVASAAAAVALAVAVVKIVRAVKRRKAEQRQNSARQGTGPQQNYAPPPQRPITDTRAVYRALLDLPPDFTQDALRERYRFLAKRYHPDQAASAPPEERRQAEEMMKQLNEAYEKLKVT
jgi:flagellar biosynthesis/type III secretory pathway M-ring protein FliF/YscJ